MERLMSKVVLTLFILLLVALLGYSGVVFFSRYISSSHQIDRMMETMSELETARVSVVLRRMSPSSNATFAFGDLRAKGVVDVRILASSAYDIDFDLAVLAGVSEDRLKVSARQEKGETLVRVVDAPAELEQRLQSQGVDLDAWNRVEGASDLRELLGEQFTWPVFSEEAIASLSLAFRDTTFLSKPQPTLTEIIHGRVARIFTAELDPDGVVAFQQAWLRLGMLEEPAVEDVARIDAGRSLFEGARVNLWIDQKNDELRRILVQLARGDTVDVEFSEINTNVVIEDPETSMLPTAEDQPREVAPTLMEDQGVDERVEGGVSPTFSTSGDRDGDGLTDNLEGFYGSNPDHSDTDGDGYTDGEEVKNGYSPTGDGSLFNFGLPTL